MFAGLATVVSVAFISAGSVGLGVWSAYAAVMAILRALAYRAESQQALACQSNAQPLPLMLNQGSLAGD